MTKRLAAYLQGLAVGMAVGFAWGSLLSGVYLYGLAATALFLATVGYLIDNE